MNSSISVSASGTTLFSKVNVLLTAAMALGGLGAFMGAGITSSGLLLVLSIIWLLSTIGVGILCAAAKVGKQDPTLAMVAAGAWTFLSGIVSGPALAMYTHVLGAHTVMGAFLGTSCVMAVCGAFGMLSGYNFSRLSGILSIALWGLIIFGLISIFVRVSVGLDIAYCVIGMLVFAGYFMVDFWRIKDEAGQGNNDWPTAILIAMMLYLDFLNFLMFVLRLLKDLKDSK